MRCSIAAKSKSVIFDSNVWIGLFVASDTQHRAANRLFLENQAVEKLVPEYVLLEVLTVIKLHTAHAVAAACLNRFLHTEQVTIVPAAAVYSGTITLFQTINEPHLSFVDVSLVALSRRCEVKTFDKKLAAAIKKITFVT